MVLFKKIKLSKKVSRLYNKMKFYLEYFCLWS